MKIVRGKENVRAQYPDLLLDESHYTCGVPRAAAWPLSHEEVCALLREAAATGCGVTTIGAQTGITGGAVPADDTIALCCGAMDRIMRAEVRDGSLFLTCQPGVHVAAIGEFLADPARCGEGVEGAEGLSPGAWFYPPDPTETTAQLGGTVATNASGARSFRWGATRTFIEALTIALSGGDTLRLRRGEYSARDGALLLYTQEGARLDISIPALPPLPTKNAAGYFLRPGMDAIDLFIGSEGTLGIFTEITIRCIDAPRFDAGLSFFPSRDAAFDFADYLRNAPGTAAVEYFDSTALTFLRERRNALNDVLPEFPPDMTAALYWEYAQQKEDASFEDCLDEWETALKTCGSSFDATWSGSDDDERRRLRLFRHALPEQVNALIASYARTCPAIRKVGTDTAVPAAAFRDLFARTQQLLAGSGMTHVIFGHLGDYHLHCNMLPHDEASLGAAHALYGQLMEMAVAAGGTVSAEHGIGKLKRRWFELMYGATGVEAMRRVKTLFDPHGRLNPGVLVDPIM